MLCKCKEEQRKAFPRPSPLPNRFHQRRLLEGVPGGEATASTAHASKEVKCLQSELNFTPDGPWWSQRGGGKCFPYALLREGFKRKPQTPAASNPRLVWRSHIPSCLLGPFSSSVVSQTQGLGSSQDQALPPAHFSQLFMAEAELWTPAGSAEHS